MDPEIARKKAEEEEEQRRAAARAHGTPVSLETFAAWKQAVGASSSLRFVDAMLWSSAY